jgi:hypothetical protein
LAFIQLPEIGGRVDCVEKWGRRRHDRNMIIPSSRR